MFGCLSQVYMLGDWNREQVCRFDIYRGSGRVTLRKSNLAAGRTYEALTMTDKLSRAAKLGGSVVPFPQARVLPARRQGGFEDLGPSKLAEQLGAPSRQGTGHWCSHCQGIWFGYLLEVACPVCGGRQG
jgi:hypothetical protein